MHRPHASHGRRARGTKSMIDITPVESSRATGLARAVAHESSRRAVVVDQAESVANRHAGTLSGRLQHLAETHVRDVHLHIDAATAQSRTGQHLLLHLINLLMRMDGVIGGVHVRWVGGDGAANAPLHAMIDPRQPEGGGSLREAVWRLRALLATGESDSFKEPQGIHVETSAHNAYGKRGPAEPLHVILGAIASSASRGASAQLPADTLCVAAGAWTAYLGDEPHACISDDEILRSGRARHERARADGRGTARVSVPGVGAYVAAAFAAGELFLRCRDTRMRASLSRRYFSAWTWSPVQGLAAGDRIAWAGGAGDATLLPFLLAGVGAVGCAFLQSVWASSYASGSGILVDGDLVARSNLNRYVLFGSNDLRQSKVLRASELLGACNPGGLHLTPLHAWWSDAQHLMGAHPVPLVISAVDTNAARHALQDALPGTILGGSTLGLRVEVSRYALLETSARCLRCFNTSERSESDATLQRRLLHLSPAELAIEAQSRRVPADALAAFVADLRAGGGGCAILDGATLQRLRHADGETAFAVSFVSSLAGTLLATQLLREGSRAGPLLAGDRGRAIFQLWHAEAASNTVHTSAADPSCVCQQVSYRHAHRRLWNHLDAPRRGAVRDAARCVGGI